MVGLANSPAAANLVIVGVTKGGTSSLFTYLAAHPDICGADVKEVRYFLPLRYGLPLPPLSDYQAHFAHCGGERYRLEASPGYLYGGAPLARAMREALPGCKIVVVLREPVARVHSFFRSHQNKFVIDPTLSFTEYLDRCEATPEGEISPDNYPLFGLYAGRYADYLGDWMDVFGEDLLVRFFQDLKRDGRGFVTEVARWLDLDPGFYESYDFAVENRSVDFRFGGLQRLAIMTNSRLERFFRRHPDLKRALRRAYYALNSRAARSHLTEAARTRLQEYYREPNQRLRELLAARGLNADRVWRYD